MNIVSAKTHLFQSGQKLLKSNLYLTVSIIINKLMKPNKFSTYQKHII